MNERIRRMYATGMSQSAVATALEIQAHRVSLAVRDMVPESAVTHNRKLSSQDIVDIAEQYRQGSSQKTIANFFNVDHSTICRALQANRKVTSVG